MNSISSEYYGCKELSLYHSLQEALKATAELCEKPKVPYQHLMCKRADINICELEATMFKSD